MPSRHKSHSETLRTSLIEALPSRHSSPSKGRVHVPALPTGTMPLPLSNQRTVFDACAMDIENQSGVLRRD